MSSRSIVSSRVCLQLHQGQITSLCERSAALRWHIYAKVPTLLSLWRNTPPIGFHFERCSTMPWECHPMFPWWASFLSYQLLHGGLCFVGNASFFRLVFEIPSQIQSNVLTQRLKCCNRWYWLLFLKNGFRQRLRPVAMRLIDRNVEERWVCRRTQCSFQFVYLWYNVSALQTDLMVRLHIWLEEVRTRHLSWNQL